MKDPVVLFGDEVCKTLPLLHELFLEYGAEPTALHERFDEMRFHPPAACADAANEEEVRLLFLTALRPHLAGAAALADAFKKLTEEQQEVFSLVDGCMCSYAETALVCGSPMGTVKSRLHRARAKL